MSFFLLPDIFSSQLDGFGWKDTVSVGVSRTHWYIPAANRWYTIAANHWYIIARKMTPHLGLAK
jgi:hypothetical protein